MQKNHDFFPKKQVRKAASFIQVRATPAGNSFAAILKNYGPTFATLLKSELYVAKPSSN